MAFRAQQCMLHSSVAALVLHEQVPRLRVSQVHVLNRQQAPDSTMWCGLGSQCTGGLVPDCNTGCEQLALYKTAGNSTGLEWRQG